MSNRFQIFLEKTILSQQGDIVPLEVLLDGKEQRAKLQHKLLQQYNQTLLSLTVLAPSHIKRNPLLDYVFKQALQSLNSLLKKLSIKPIEHIIRHAESGDEAFFILPINATYLKHKTIMLEESSPIGRLWDFDIFNSEGKQIGRDELGYSPRSCLICKEHAKICARSRSHSLIELQNEMKKRVMQHQLALFVARQVKRALWKEASLTPKPGLVDRNNNGSHHDMSLNTFAKSISALFPFWQQFFWLGCNTSSCTPQDTLVQLRKLGLQAEQIMYQATQGINTHKGGIFAFGLTCAAIGRCWTLGHEISVKQICMTVADFCKGITNELHDTNKISSGISIFQRYGIKGARGEAEAGFPLVRYHSLPYLNQQLQNNETIDQALLKTMLILFIHNEDSNVIHRGGIDGFIWFRERSTQIFSALSHEPEKLISELNIFNQQCIEKNISAGGSADLLALTYFFSIFFN